MQRSTIALLAVIVLVGWRLVARVRRLLARQESRLWRHRTALLVFPFLVGLLFVGALGENGSLLALAGGTTTGGALALVGFRRTRLEVTDDGRCFYTPCRPIGATLAILLAGRVAYQAVEWFEARDAGLAGSRPLELTPTTLFVFSTFAIYYSAYSFGLLSWRARIGRR